MSDDGGGGGDGRKQRQGRGFWSGFDWGKWWHYQFWIAGQGAFFILVIGGMWAFYRDMNDTVPENVKETRTTVNRIEASVNVQKKVLEEINVKIDDVKAMVGEGVNDLKDKIVLIGEEVNGVNEKLEEEVKLLKEKRWGFWRK